MTESLNPYQCRSWLKTAFVPDLCRQESWSNGKRKSFHAISFHAIKHVLEAGRLSSRLCGFPSNAGAPVTSCCALRFLISSILFSYRSLINYLSEDAFSVSPRERNEQSGTVALFASSLLPRLMITDISDTDRYGTHSMLHERSAGAADQASSLGVKLVRFSVVWSVRHWVRHDPSFTLPITRRTCGN